MLGGILNLKRTIGLVAEERAAQGKKPDKRILPEDLAPTQECIMVVAAHSNILILRDYSVVAAVGLGSMSHTILDSNALHAKLNAYQLMLKYVRFDFQFLIGTRPQNLGSYHAKLATKLQRMGQMQTLVDRLAFHLPEDVEKYPVEETAAQIKKEKPEADAKNDPANKLDAEKHFAEKFGFTLNDIYGVPGEAHALAAELANPFTMAELKAKPPDEQQTWVKAWLEECDYTNKKLAHWRSILQDRDDTVEAIVIGAKAPVRTFTLVTSFNPRLLTGMGKTPLTESELKRATDELNRRCAQLQAGMTKMGFPSWRVSHEELLEEIQYFYHPGTGRADRALVQERSIGMQLARVR